MFDDIIMKVIDNFVLNIKQSLFKYRNVHVRVEQENEIPYYSMGVTVQEISIHSTNDKWEKGFIDRSKSKSAYSFRIFSLTRFGLYFNPIETNITKNIEIKIDDKFQQIIKPCKIYLNNFSKHDREVSTKL